MGITRGLVVFVCLTAICFASPTNSFAEDEAVLRTRNIVDGWEKWLKKHKVSEAAIAISYWGKAMGEFGLGREATTPAPVASLSKAVTGICIAKLVDNGEISFDDALNSIIPELDSTVRVNSLLKHTSGYIRDITQRPDKYIGHNKEYLVWVSKKEISKGRDKKQVGKFNYNNANYAMLGAIIRKVTGKTYEEACKELVFAPIGVTDVSLNPDWRIMSSWGGWKISALDYNKFLQAYFTNRQVLGKLASALPNHQFGNGVSYGMGYNFRTGRKGGTNFWHDGKWHTDRGGKKYRFAAYFVSFDNGWVITVNHNISAINGEHNELDRLFGTETHKPL